MNAEGKEGRAVAGSPISPRKRIRRGKGWRLAVGLLLLSVVPTIAGISRLVELGSNAAISDENRRFFDAPVPIVLHILAAIIFSLAGAVQFVPSLRRRGHRWHRMAGRAVAPAGFVVALTGLWMTFTYALPAADNALLAVFRVVAGVGMLGCLVAAVASLRLRKYRNHGAWMARAYGIGLGAGTQVLTYIPWFVALGEPTPMARAWLMFAGWFINVCVVEWKLWQGRVSTRRTASFGTLGA